MTRQSNHPAVIRLNAGNDTNGNPRRVYVALSSDPEGGTYILGAWDEEYRGYHCVPKKLHKSAQFAPTFDTTPAEYRLLLRSWAGVWPKDD